MWTKPEKKRNGNKLLIIWRFINNDLLINYANITGYVGHRPLSAALNITHEASIVFLPHEMDNVRYNIGIINQAL
jgi:hypothetical protein